MVTGEIVAMALNATDWRRGQIQGFCYDLEDGRQEHVLRDLTKPYGEQRVWREIARREDYDAAHKRMMLAKEQADAATLADRINRLMGSQA